VLPEVLEHARRLARGLADDEAVRHVLHAGRRGGAERLAPGPGLRHPHRDLQRRRAVVDLVEEAAEVAREVVERAAGGDDVDEAEQRRPEVGVLRGEVHRLVVDRLQRVAARPRQRRGEIAPDRDDVGFRSRRACHGLDDIGSLRRLVRRRSRVSGVSAYGELLRLGCPPSRVAWHPRGVAAETHRMDAFERPPPWLQASGLARRQFGVLSGEQLREVGLGRGAVQNAVRVGRLHRVHHGVYALGHALLRPEGHRLAAVLACGPGAVLSHRSAAAHWGAARDPLKSAST
jgi:hypothetical protein